MVGRKTIKKRLRSQLKEIKPALRRRLHELIGKTGEWLKRILRVHLNYHAVLGDRHSYRDRCRRIRRGRAPCPELKRGGRFPATFELLLEREEIVEDFWNITVLGIDQVFDNGGGGEAEYHDVAGRSQFSGRAGLGGAAGK